MLHVSADQQRPEKDYETSPFATIDHGWENGQKQWPGARGVAPVLFAKVLKVGGADQVQGWMPEPKSWKFGQAQRTNLNIRWMDEIVLEDGTRNQLGSELRRRETYCTVSLTRGS